MFKTHPETTHVIRTEPHREVRRVRRFISGTLAACVLSLLQVTANRRERRLSHDPVTDW